MRYSKIGICLTDRCNARCRMCCFSCGPEKSLVFHEEQLESLIEQASRIEGIRAIGLSGGEAMLYPDLVKHCVNSICIHGMQATLTTNGFWADTEEHALTRLEELKEQGLSSLSVSIDACHLEYIDITCTVNILRANRKTGIPLTLAMGDVRNSRRAFDIIKDLDSDIYETNVVIYPFLPVGSGESLDPDSTVFKPFHRDWTCPAGGELLIGADGKVYPCCSQGAYKSVLSNGSIHSASLKELVGSYERFCYFSLLNQKGFGWFYEILRNIEKIELPCEYVSPCHLCHTIFSNEEICKRLTPYAEQYLLYHVTK